MSTDDARSQVPTPPDPDPVPPPPPFGTLAITLAAVAMEADDGPLAVAVLHLQGAAGACLGVTTSVLADAARALLRLAGTELGGLDGEAGAGPVRGTGRVLADLGAALAAVGEALLDAARAHPSPVAPDPWDVLAAEYRKGFTTIAPEVFDAAVTLCRAVPGLQPSAEALQDSATVALRHWCRAQTSQAPTAEAAP